MTIRLVLLLLMVACTPACVQNRYAWNGYDTRLYSYYRTPAESEQFMEGLYEIIQKADAEGRVPPGIYAEYGYQLYERGKFAEAVVWYLKERDKWPESRLLMDKMIALAGNSKARTGTNRQEQQPQGLQPSAKEGTP